MNNLNVKKLSIVNL
uniref:Uncharacterized protein n=1 Tax=Arundo donax TaxID=35708 RepID=A0A0A8ZCW3_ARUDO